MHLKVQLPVLFKTHDHVTENGDSVWHNFTEGQNFHLMKKYSGKTDEESAVEQTMFQRWCLFSPS